MKKTYLALAFLITGFLLAGNAYGEDEVYYCAEIDSNGFKYDMEQRSYKPKMFLTSKLKMQLDRASNRIVLAHENRGKEIYTCTIPYPNQPELIDCKEKFFYFAFNTKTGKFVYTLGFGYVYETNSAKPDSLTISYGKCDKF